MDGTEQDCAELHNLGGSRWSLTLHIAGSVHSFPDLRISEDESPRDAAVREIAALGCTVAGDGSWWVGAYIGPGADRSWAPLVVAAPANST